jgi:hypothetical protein
MADAAGLVIAGDHADARAYAALLRGLTGRRPVVVLSDDPMATRKIASFAASDERWMVAVRMVCEGVDIPRPAVGVYATSVSTADEPPAARRPPQGTQRPGRRLEPPHRPAPRHDPRRAPPGLRRPPLPRATAAEIQARIAKIRAWALSGR